MNYRVGSAFAVALAVTGCGSTKIVTETVTQTLTKTVAVVRTVTATPKASPAKKTATSVAGGRNGLTIDDFSNDVLSVVPTLIDPAEPANSYELQPDANTRYLAIKLTLTDIGPGAISDDANSDLAVIGTDGQNYTPVFAGVLGCTNFTDGEYHLVKGTSQVGCVTFDLPDGVKVKAVQFSLGGNTIQFNA